MRIPLLLALLTVSISAQTPQRLIGLTQTVPLVVTQDMTTCAMAQCSPLAFPAAVNPLVGATAHDPIARGTWISDGLMLARVDARNQCVYQCPPFPAPNTTPNNPITGMAFNEITKTLFITDLSGVIRWYNVAGCALTLVNRCIAPLPTGCVLTGCATDDAAGLIYYCCIVPGTPGGRVFVAPQTAPCSPICSFPITTCGGAPMNFLTGLAFDSCKGALWATDGKMTVGGTVAIAGGVCTFTEFQCCLNTSGDRLIGLCILPSIEVSLGNSCTNPTCPPCPTMRHVLTGDATIGNTISWDLISAPAGSNAYLILNAGSCAGPGVVFGSFCGPVLVPLAPPPVVIGALPTGGGVGCTGSAAFGLTLPANPAFCGATLATQYLGLCFTGGAIGTFVSNCLTLAISAS